MAEKKYIAAIVPTAHGYTGIFPGLDYSARPLPTVTDARRAARQILHLRLIMCLIQNESFPKMFSPKRCREEAEALQKTWGGSPDKEIVYLEIHYDMDELQRITEQIAAQRDADPEMDIEITPDMWAFLTRKDE